ncbi:MAG TPA: HlyD family efflux transporter periplasmic adaptor subunit [Symbiobacteriaceae bacterium]|nr:HlyD family efflux transporter periplasmic adaptor subunit [Symbiobacteriaceae bacterium]
MPQFATARRSNLRALRRELPPHRRPASGWRRALLAALAGIAVLGAAALVYRNLPVPVETVALTQGSVEITYAVDGLIARQEEVYTAPADGRLRRLVAEGQRVRVGSPVAEIVEAGTAQEPAPPGTPPDPVPQGDIAIRREIDRITAAIYDRASAINLAKANGDGEAAARLQDELDQLAVRQEELSQQLGRSQPVVVAPAPLLSPEQPVGRALGVIKAGTSGIVIYQTDGLEGRLSGELKPSALAAMGPRPHAPGETVRQGEAVLKIVDNLNTTLLAVLPEEALTRLGGANRVTIRLDGRDARPVSGRITGQVREGGQVLLTLSASAMPEELVLQRRFRATLVMGAYEGLTVPRTALDVRDGLQGVWVLEGLETRFHPVRVLGGNDQVLALETDLAVGVRVLRYAPTSMR